MWQSAISQFSQTSLLEWVGTISGFACVYLAAKQHILNWPVSIISVLSYAILFFEYKLYGDALLQIYFLGAAIYGWYYWIYRREHHKKPIVKYGQKELALTVLVVVVLSVLLGLFLEHYTDSTVPYMDGFCTAISFVAQFLMTRKVLQNWLLWIIADISYIPLYIYKNLYLTAVLYFLFLILATIGYLDWRRTWKMALEK